MNAPDSYSLQQDDEISLLDLLLVIAENLRLLVIGPLVVGVLALAGTFAIPPVYESTAVLKGTQQVASMMTTQAVIDPVIAKLNLRQAGESDDLARLRFKGSIKASFSPKDSLVSVSVASVSPESAQQLLNELLRSYFEQSKPRGSEKDRLTSLLASTDDRIKEASLVARQMQGRIALENPKASADMAQGYATLVASIDSLEQKRQDVSKTLAGVDESLLVQQPTLNKLKVRPKRALVAVVAALATGFVLLLVVFVRSAWANAAGDAQSSVKLAQLKALLRRALGRV